MSFKSVLAQMVPALLITIVTGLPFFQASAQVRCEQVFTNTFTAKASLYDRQNWVVFNQLEIASVYLKTALTKNRGALTTMELSQRTRRLQYLTENYLRSAGLKFEPFPISIAIEGLRDAPIYQLNYSGYRLIGTADGAETARLIYGVQSNPNFSAHPLRVELDPYYFVEGMKKDRDAHFDAWTKTLRLGPDILSDDFLGLSSTLRHEIHHYLEHMKVLRGEMSLARIQLTSARDKTVANVYDKFLAVDEIEAWLRDIRSLLNDDLQDSKNKKYTPLIRPEHQDKLVPFLRGQRLMSAKTAIEQVEFFINQTQGSLEALVRPGNITSFRRQKDNEGRHFIQIILQEAPYETLRFEFTGLMTIAEMDTPKIDTVMTDFSVWNGQRLTEVSAELATLKQKFQEKLNALSKE